MRAPRAVAEEGLVGRAQAGDLAAFESIVRAWYPRLLGFAARRVPEFDAEEVVQETFLKAFGGIRKLRIPERFGPWLYAICRNEVVNSFRASGEQDDDGGIPADLVDDRPGPTDSGSRAELVRAVARLGDRHKDVIRLRYFEGLSLKRIGSVLHLRVALVKSRLHEARETLRRQLPVSAEADGGPPALMPLLKEAVMKSVELTRNAANIFSRLSLEDQVKVCEAVAQGGRFESGLVQGISRLEGGLEFIQACDAHLDERELAAVLNYADDGVRARCLEAAEKRVPLLVEHLRRAMVLPELNPGESEGLRLGSLTIEGCSEGILVSLNGYLDDYNAAYLQERLGAVMAGGYRWLVLDCAGLTYISSTGIGALTALRNELARRGGDVCILAMQTPVRDVFVCLNISEFFVFRQTREEATGWARESARRAPGEVPSERSFAADTRRLLCGLDTSENGAPLQTRRVRGDSVFAFGYLGMPRGATGEYLCVRRLDEGRVAGIVSDSSGRGAPAFDAATKVAAVFQSLLADGATRDTAALLEQLAYAINDVLHNEGAPTTFCALQALILDGSSGDCAIVHCGAPVLRIFDPRRGVLVARALAAAPSAGSFSSSLVRRLTGFRVERLQVEPGAGLFLCSDGIEESRRAPRDADLAPIATPHRAPWEQFGPERMAEVIAAVMARGRYELVREHCGGLKRTDRFDFGRCSGSVEDAVLGLAAVEEVFRLTPVSGDRQVGTHQGPGIAVVPPQVDRVLSECLVSYSELFSRRVRVLSDAVHYAGLLQEQQFDGVALLGIERKGC